MRRAWVRLTVGNSPCLRQLTYVRYVGNYGTSGNQSNEYPDVSAKMLEEEKTKNLSGKTVSSISESPGWNERLASYSEANIKADRSPDKNIDELVWETERILESDNDLNNK
eukprot:TRINITY_DN685_c0_g1_i1.p1 TRINITY_DN685_c0_g1~~TRINITY_DN685_c0_g1_i1.p1  ORF type:complete len:111 (-),score=26.64 TRINITY_DN685_c0_g1_i1:60-392(-)